MYESLRDECEIIQNEKLEAESMLRNKQAEFEYL